MTSSFDQPDDASAWGWSSSERDPLVRTPAEMLSDLDEALDLLQELDELGNSPETAGTEFDAPESCSEPDDFGEAWSYRHGLSDHSSGEGGDSGSLVSARGDWGAVPEHVFIASAAEILEKVAFVHAAVSQLIVAGDSRPASGGVDFPDSPTAAESQNQTAVNQNNESCWWLDSNFKNPANGFPLLDETACNKCHTTGHQEKLWLRRAGQASDPVGPDLERSHAAATGTSDSRNRIGSSVNPDDIIYVVFDGKAFVVIESPDSKKPDCTGVSDGRPEDDAVTSSHAVSAESRDPLPSVMRQRNAKLWGPHWTNSPPTEAGGSHDQRPPMKGPPMKDSNPEVSEDTSEFPTGAGPRRALPGNGGVPLRRRNNAARSRYLRCNATPGTCRAVRLSSRSSEGCRDKRSCRVRGPKGGQ